MTDALSFEADQARRCALTEARSSANLTSLGRAGTLKRESHFLST